MNARRVAVLGAGSWGTALAALCAANGHDTRLWARDVAIAEAMTATGRNARYLPDVDLPASLRFTADLGEAMHGLGADDWVVLGIPSKVVADIARAALACTGATSPPGWVLTCKGFDPLGGGPLLAPMRAALGAGAALACLSGPSFAREVALGQPTAVAVAADSAEVAANAAAVFHNGERGGTFRAYSSDDLMGVHIGGALKNPLAIAAGVLDGLAFGANARAALVTRGLAELARLGLALGGRRETFMGLSGLGDLLLTCSDDQSRNRRFGLALGAGRTPDEAEADIGQTVEGRRAAAAALALANAHDVELPIIAAVDAVIAGRVSPREAVGQLLARQPREEG